MIIHLLASGAILLGCAYLGILFASSYRRRVEQIVEFENVLMQLEFDIDFMGVTLDESLEKIVKNCNGGVQDVLRYVCERLRKDRFNDMPKLWERGFKRFKSDIFLTDEDMGILIEFSKTLGCGDKTREKSNIKMASMRLKLAEEEAREEAKRNMKMYRGLGLLTGVFLVIVLI